MTKKSKQIDRLRSLTLALRQAEEAKLAVLKTQESRLRANLDSLEETRSLRASALSKDLDAAALAGADFRWSRWADQRRVALNADLARLRVRKSALIGDLARAWGRDEVSRKLSEEMKHRDAAERQKRLDQTS